MGELQNLQLNKTDEKDRKWGIVLVIISAIGFGLMAIFAKFAYAANLNMVTILSVRFTITALILWFIIMLSKESPWLAKKEIINLLLLGAMGYGLMSSCFFSAVRLIPASVASILLYTYPIIVTFLSSWIYSEKINMYKLISLLVSFIGLVLVVGVVLEGLSFIGIIFGLMSALIYSLYIIISNKYVNKINPIVFTTYIATSAAVVFNTLGWSTGQINLTISLQGWLSILGIAVFSSVVGILTFYQGMKYIGPSRASIISTLEPVVTTVSAFILFDEKMTVLQLVGGALVIGAVIVIQKDK